ncbi:MAG: hypothetical protein INR73_24340, partial [Williamsia sp.]|nr:hypothetical protein [Williamsia sp.]
MRYSIGNTSGPIHSNNKRSKSFPVIAVAYLFIISFLLGFSNPSQAQCSVTATLTRNATVCQNAASPLVTFKGANGYSPYVFTYRVNGGANQTITSIAGDSVSIPVPTNVTGTFVYQLVKVADAVSCERSISLSVGVTVNSLPTATISGNASVCQGTGAPVVFTGANGTPPYTFTYTLNGGSTQTIATGPGSSVSLPAPTGTPGTYTYRLLGVTDNNGCSQVQTGTATVTVGVGSSLGLSSASGTDAQGICLGSSITPLTYTAGGTGTISITAGSLPAGVTGIYSGGVFTISGTPTATGTYNFTVTAAGGCNNPTMSGSIKVNAVTAGTIGTDQTFCSGADPSILTSITNATATGTLSYQWQISTVSCSAGFTNITGPGANTDKYDPPKKATTTAYYRRVATSTYNGVVCTAISNCVTVAILDIAGGTIGSDQLVCSGILPAQFSNQASATSSAGIITYQWQKSTQNCTNGFTNIAGAVGAVYTELVYPSATTYYRRVATATLNGVSCTAASNCVTLIPGTVSAGAIGTSDTLCSGVALALTQTAAASGSGALSYQWQSNTTGCNGTFADISGATSATYSIPAGLTTTTYFRRVVSTTVSGVVCSAVSNCVTIAITSITPGSVAGGGQTFCSGGNSGSFTSTAAAAGSGTITYQWQRSTTDCNSGFTNISGATAATYTPPAGLTATAYYRRVASTTANGISCQAYSNCLVIYINSITDGTTSGNQSICAGQDPAAFSATAATGTGTITYQWQSSTTDCNSGFSNISGATSAGYNPPAGLTATTYYRRIVNATLNGVVCTATGNCITVTVNPVSQMTSTSSVTICSGGSVNIPLSSTLPSTYTWTATANPNTTGETATTETGTVLTDTIFNSSTTTQTVTYSVVPKSTASGCAGPAQTVTVTVYPTLAVTIAANYCYGGGKVQLTANSNVPGVGFLWNTGETTQSILVDLAGGYWAKATTTAGCSSTAYIQVANEQVVNGDFSAGNTGFTSSYGYVDSTIYNGLYPETKYTVGSNPNFNHDNFWGRDHTTNKGRFLIVNGAGKATTVVWQQSTTVRPNTTYYFAAWAISLNSVPPYAQLQFAINGTTFGTTAVLAARPNNNNPPYNWVRFYGTWNSGSSTSATISVVDLQTAAGGNDFGLDDISFGTLDPVPFTVDGSTAVCAGSTLTLTPNVKGGSGTINYSWTGPNGFTSKLANPVIPNASAANAGVYTLTVSDAYGCPMSGKYTVTVNPLPTLTLSKTNVACNGNATGTIAATVAGGTKPYTYSWSNGAKTKDLTGLAAGTYMLTVTDSAGCTASGAVTITQPAVLTATKAVTNVKCNGGSTGSVVITPSGGTAPYTITPVQTGLAAGNYTFTVTDANGCTLPVQVAVTQPAALAATAAVTHVKCSGASTGAVDLTVSGGTAPYTYLWSNGVKTQDVSGLAAGSYIYTVTDAQGCTWKDTVVVTQPAALAAAKVVTNVKCNGGATGSVVITPSGGVAPYTIAPAQTGLAAGNYTFTVTDANGCTLPVAVTITQPAVLSATKTIANVKCNGGATGSVVITPSGGTAPYVITPAQTGLVAGNYTFTVTDSNGCSIPVPVTITQPAVLGTGTVVMNVKCNGAATGAIDLTVSGGTAPYTYAWSNGAKTEDVSGLAAGSYTYTVTDAGGCTAGGTVTVTQPATLTATSVATNVKCNGGATGSVTITPSGGVAPYTITPAQTGLAAGSYTFTVKDANNCTIAVPVNITQPAALGTSTVVTSVKCNGTST